MSQGATSPALLDAGTERQRALQASQRVQSLVQSLQVRDVARYPFCARISPVVQPADFKQLQPMSIPIPATC